MKTTNPPVTRKPPRYGLTKREAEELRGLIARLRGCLARTDGPRARCAAAALKLAEQIAGIDPARAGAR